MITPREILDVAIMTAAVGYIFMDVFSALRKQHSSQQGFDWGAFWQSCAVTAPALILHELGHKFTAIALGMKASFHAAYAWLGVGVLLKVLRSGIIFFVPAYVVPECPPPCTVGPDGIAIMAFAGPALNLVLFIVAFWILKTQKKNLSRKAFIFWHFTKQLNILLFVLNMLPLPLFDGFKVYAGLWHLFTS